MFQVAYLFHLPKNDKKQVPTNFGIKFSSQMSLDLVLAHQFRLLFLGSFCLLVKCWRALQLPLTDLLQMNL